MTGNYSLREELFANLDHNEGASQCNSGNFAVFHVKIYINQSEIVSWVQVGSVLRG